MFWGVFLRRSLRYSGQYSLNCEKKSSSIASGSILTKLGALLKMSPCLEYWGILYFNQGYKLRAPCGVPLWYLLASWRKDDLIFILHKQTDSYVQWSCKLRCSVELLNIVRSACFEFISCTATPESCGEWASSYPWWPGKEKQSPVIITLSSQTDQLMSTTWRRGKEEYFFQRTSPSRCFCRYSFRGW